MDINFRTKNFTFVVIIFSSLFATNQIKKNLLTGTFLPQNQEIIEKNKNLGFQAQPNLNYSSSENRLPTIFSRLDINRTSYTFTSCGAFGTEGPSQEQSNIEYVGTNLEGMVTVNNGIQQWIVPETGPYTITAAGASGGYTPSIPGGRGRAITIEVDLLQDDVLDILVGQEGGRGQISANGAYAGGGGGGTFIIKNGSPILVSGGGGGSGEGTGSFIATLPGADASSYENTNGSDGTGYSGSWNPPGTGGVNGNGGNASGSGGAGGGGYNTDGSAGYYAGIPGKAYVNGGFGGINRIFYGTFSLDIQGGFGGGSGAGLHSNFEANAGGGGGYSGGGGGATRVGSGGGGGNYFTGTYISSDLNTGDGLVVITGSGPSNSNPSITSTPPVDALDGSVYEYTISSSDVDGDDVVITATTKPDWLSLSNVNFYNNTNSLSFDGVDDYVDLNYTNGQIESEISILAWVNLNNNSNGGHIIFNGFGGTDANWHWGMQLEDSDAGGGIQPKIMLHTDQGINGAGHKPSPNNGIIAPNSGWHHVAMTYSNSTLKIYLDGIEVHTETVQGNYITESSRVNIGGWENFDETFSGSMDGKIDEISVWNIALSDAEIQSNYNAVLAGNESGLVGYWNFNDGEGSTLTDLSSNGNNGTIYGATWSTDFPLFTASTTVLSGTPSHLDGGLHTIVLSADDGNGGIATQSYTLAVSLHSLEVSGESGFRMFSSPVSGLIYEDLLDELWTQGAVGSDNPNSNPNIWTFGNEWNSVTDFSADALNAGKGFLMYVYADTDFDGVDDLPVTISIDGPQQQIGISVTTEPSEWNMMGNPYGLAVDITQMVSDNDGPFNKTVYALDLDNPGYKFHNGNIGTIDDGEIKPFEGFWIQATESGNTFQFTEQSIKKGSVSAPSRTTTDGSNGHAVFTFSNGTYSSSTYLSFTPEGEINLDPADADRLVPMSLVEHLTSMIYESNKSLAINNLPSDLTTDLTMAMDVMMLTPDNNNGYATQAEQIEFSWDISNLPEGITLGLTDNVTGQAIHLTEGVSTGISTVNKGSFETAGGFMGTYPAVGESQFTLMVYGITTAAIDDEILPERVTLNEAYPNPFNPSTVISFDLKDADMVSLDIFDITGRQVATLVHEYMVPGNHQVSWNPGNLSSGLYLVNLVVGIETFNQKITYIK
jgi:hypothetical protein